MRSTTSCRHILQKEYQGHTTQQKDELHFVVAPRKILELEGEHGNLGHQQPRGKQHQAQQIKSIETGYHDVDINGHINSVKFIEHVMDLWETEWYCKHRLKRVDVAYVAEGHKGDKLELYREQTGEMEFCVRVCRAGADGTELCRMKLVFEN